MFDASRLGGLAAANGLRKWPTSRGFGINDWCFMGLHLHMVKAVNTVCTMASPMKLYDKHAY
jgi:hypothetical protein